MRKLILRSIGIIIITSFYAFVINENETNDKVKILLIGDSTTAGGKAVFENSIEEILAGEDSIPEVEAVNVGLGGETAYSLLNSGRYDREVKGIPDVDYIFVRYGINDWIHRKPFAENFPADMKNVIGRLREDYPSAQIILMTIVPFLGEHDTEINDQIKQIATEENLELFDIYTPYKEKMDEFGRNAFTVRFCPLSEIPENYHKLVAPYTKFVEWKNTDMVRCQTNEFDALFGHLTGWYKDPHPNTTGYRLIAAETAKYMIPVLKK